MLKWIPGQNEHLADNSKVLEPPETPAPVFAIRAFKSALFGTPAAEDEQGNEQTPRPKLQPASRRRSDSDSLKPPTLLTAGDALKSGQADTDPAVNNMSSPTKSILLTPGTASNRRKTVSFGDSVVDNERKRDCPPSKTPRTPMSPGSVSGQWASGSSDGKGKPRSKLTQALMDSRDKDPKPTESQPAQKSDPKSTEVKTVSSSSEEDNNDDTINLNEPRSQSGKYWKAEFDSYRNKTTREIRKLIQYRSAAKQYAHKKDAEALRLADKLREEEVKVAEMERHVSQLASTMVDDNSKANKEQLVQDLTKQTALALQYKHRVTLLRKLLEEQGVVGHGMEDITEPTDKKGYSEATELELLKTQQALEQANAKIEDMKLQQSDFSKLKDLAQSSEQKASDLEKENASLKQTLARVKQEMTKYEARRKEKESRLRQRETKLETRVQEYRERLRASSQQHRETEEHLKQSFNEERRRMQEQVDLLKLKVETIERLPELRARTNRFSDSPRKGYTGVQVLDFGQSSPQRDEHHNEDEETADPPSPSPKRYHPSRNTIGDLELKRALKAIGADDHTGNFSYPGDSPHKTTNANFPDDIDLTVPPPSSPPEYSPRPPPHSTKYKHPSNTNTNTNIDSHTLRNYHPHHTTNDDPSHQLRTEPLRARRRSPTKYSLDALSALPETYPSATTTGDRGRKRQSLATATFQRESIPVDRMVAAQARLKRKDDTRKGRDEGKENVRTYNN